MYTYYFWFKTRYALSIHLSIAFLIIDNNYNNIDLWFITIAATLLISFLAPTYCLEIYHNPDQFYNILQLELLKNSEITFIIWYNRAMVSASFRYKQNNRQSIFKSNLLLGIKSFAMIITTMILEYQSTCYKQLVRVATVYYCTVPILVLVLQQQLSSITCFVVLNQC